MQKTIRKGVRAQYQVFCISWQSTADLESTCMNSPSVIDQKGQKSFTVVSGPIKKVKVVCTYWQQWGQSSDAEYKPNSHATNLAISSMRFFHQLKTSDHLNDFILSLPTVFPESLNKRELISLKGLAIGLLQTKYPLYHPVSVLSVQQMNPVFSVQQIGLLNLTES